MDAGHLAEGRRADIVVVDPAGLNADLDAYHEAPVEAFGGLSRMVRRNDDAVRATILGGQVVYTPAGFCEGFGEKQAAGRFLAPTV